MSNKYRRIAVLVVSMLIISLGIVLWSVLRANITRSETLSWRNAVIAGDVEVAKTLLEKNETLTDSRLGPGEIVASGGMTCAWNDATALMVASLAHDISLVDLLLQYGADPDAIDDRRIPVIVRVASCRKDTSEVFESLARAGANLNTLRKRTMHDRGDPPIFHVALRGDLDGLKSLHRLGADLFILNVDGESALHYAALGGHAHIAEYLLDNGFDPNIQTKRGETPLHRAGEISDAFMTVMTMHGAEIERKDNKGWTPLLTKARGGNHWAVRALLNAGANPTATAVGDERAYSCLHAAIQFAEFEIVKMLIEAGARVDERAVELADSIPNSFALAEEIANIRQTLIDNLNPED